MDPVRPFEPHFVFAVGPWFVAVDRIQPVALVLSPDGERSSLVSWADLVPAPPVTPWPSRQAAVVGDGVVVQDLPDGTPVTLAVGPDGRARPSADPLPGGVPRGARHSRLWSAGPRVRTADPVWTFESVIDGFSLGGRIARPGAPDLAVDGSIVDFDEAGSAAVACVQRVDKRPWPFHRRASLLALSAGSPGIAVREIPNPDVGALGWPARSADRWGTEALADYLRFTVNTVASAIEAGIREPRITVRDPLTDPRIAITFTHPDFPDHEFVREDRPFNELGNLGEGLRELNVSLTEDIGSGVLAYCASRATGPLVHC